jgi:hypothetical protein
MAARPGCCELVGGKKDLPCEFRRVTKKRPAEITQEEELLTVDFRYIFVLENNRIAI